MDLSLEDYTKAVVRGLLNKFPTMLLKYTGTDAEAMGKMITLTLVQEGTGYVVDTPYSLIEMTVEDHWEADHTVAQAVKDLYEPVDTYISAQASVM